MAAGEYVSVHAQADTETADLAREQAELNADAGAELNELSAIYVGRGVEPELARQVATQLMAHDALAAHARDQYSLPVAAGSGDAEHQAGGGDNSIVGAQHCGAQPADAVGAVAFSVSVKRFHWISCAGRGSGS